MIDLPPTKSAARAQIRARRRERAAGMRGPERDLLAQAYARVLLGWLASRGTPGTITAYESWPSEPPTERLLVTLGEAGWRVLVPETLPDRDLSWHEYRHEYHSTEDLGQDAVALADVVLVPALAIDRDGYRLGQGGGSYDRALPRARPGSPVVAMVFEDELVRSVPREAHDRRVDAVLTADGVRALT